MNTRLSTLSSAIFKGWAQQPARRPSRPATRGLQLEAVESRLLLSAVVATDLPDYAPGDTALISAYNDNSTTSSDFAAGELVKFQVVRTDGIEDFPSGNLPWFVRDGQAEHLEDSDGDGSLDLLVKGDSDGVENGAVGSSWFVEGQYAGATLRLTAQGQTSGAVATHDFTDGPLATAAFDIASMPINTPTSVQLTLKNTPTTVGAKPGIESFTITLASETSLNGTPTIVAPAGWGYDGSITVNDVTVLSFQTTNNSGKLIPKIGRAHV